MTDALHDQGHYKHGNSWQLSQLEVWVYPLLLIVIHRIQKRLPIVAVVQR